MKLTLLCDNHTYIDRYYLGEPAFSVLIEDGKTTVLFDTGYSGVFIENARRMGIDLAKVTHIVLSHGHNDHTGGLAEYRKRFAQPVTLVAHPAVFARRRCDGLEVGSPIGPEELGENTRTVLRKEPIWLTERICFLGEIPRGYPFECGRSVGERFADGAAVPDDLPDDTALALRTEEGLFLLTGCAHAGVANTLRYALEVTGERRVAAVMGGMHLFETDDDFRSCMRELKRLGTERLIPCHCTSLAVKAAMTAEFDTAEAGVGMTLTLGR
ncbi:MAG: MBL fold metallo-hydrolase [Clostridia bacterium]|nr:MBL fold metallo-hydrolase [Clostridia bacterium]